MLKKLIEWLLGPREVKVCEKCEVLQTQLELANAEKHELLESVMALLRPKVNYEQVINRQVEKITPQIMTISRRRAMMEERDRKEAIAKTSKFSGQPDNQHNINKQLDKNEIEELEAKLGLNEEPQ